MAAQALPAQAATLAVPAQAGAVPAKAAAVFAQAAAQAVSAQAMPAQAAALAVLAQAGAGPAQAAGVRAQVVPAQAAAAAQQQPETPAQRFAKIIEDLGEEKRGAKQYVYMCTLARALAETLAAGELKDVTGMKREEIGECVQKAFDDPFACIERPDRQEALAYGRHSEEVCGIQRGAC
jgi:hypothetical protein